ncbi:MAG: hypothetical protein J0M07_31300 [Anaerolineae bacterium]|jgi:hypothetical protein|uniref:hypothetical protein n=1 Tax=Candidatus Flexifilum breve TaxID=3140694 RepID=UPI001ACC0904|nr:hypothetical protein [Chloroflexota bacterium]MBK8029571.1 hypothetical protein [Chloroflexota bacterium]MBK9747138.1 hypothetical protein [Chloroflexota bacterium]MBN8639841.1 hypothetical protein [Anaerolineae bacterium]
MSQNDVNQQLQRAADAQQKYSDYLMGLPHVIGVAVGYTSRHGQREAEIGLIVMVDEKLPVAQLAESEIVPRQLDGVRVDVQETGAFSTF